MIQRNIDRAPPGGRGFHGRLRRLSRTRHQVQDRGRTPDGQALPADQLTVPGMQLNAADLGRRPRSNAFPLDRTAPSFCTM